ncbi:hypothetical protein EDB83DRAFT_2552642 [Lactarius deliciosus]|nr:hypothetical protein EDB83DRAFT_2552642 [Lactarius deliciosus]
MHVPLAATRIHSVPNFFPVPVKAHAEQDHLAIPFKNKWSRMIYGCISKSSRVDRDALSFGRRRRLIDFDPGRVYGQLVKPLRPITDCFSGITAVFLDLVTMTLPDMQTHPHAFINSSTMTVRLNRICKPYSFRTYLASALQCSSTTRAVDRSSRDWYGLSASGYPMQDRGPGGYDFEGDARACVDLLKAKIKNSASRCDQVDEFPTKGPSSRCIMILVHASCTRGSDGVRTAIGNRLARQLQGPRSKRHRQARYHRKCRIPKPDWRSADEDRKHETSSPPPGGNGSTLFATVTNLNAHLTAVMALLLFS